MLRTLGIIIAIIGVIGLLGYFVFPRIFDSIVARPVNRIFDRAQNSPSPSAISEGLEQALRPTVTPVPTTQPTSTGLPATSGIPFPTVRPTATATATARAVATSVATLRNNRLPGTGPYDKMMFLGVQTVLGAILVVAGRKLAKYS
jgi:hypothetical protein